MAKLTIVSDTLIRLLRRGHLVLAKSTIVSDFLYFEVEAPDGINSLCSR